MLYYHYKRKLVEKIWDKLAMKMNMYIGINMEQNFEFLEKKSFLVQGMQVALVWSLHTMQYIPCTHTRALCVHIIVHPGYIIMLFIVCIIHDTLRLPDFCQVV